MHDLLRDELISIATPTGLRRVSLPSLFAHLARGEVERYTGLRPHQEDPWRVFLVQLAASVLARSPRDTLPTDDGYWRDGLLDLADGAATAWELVVEEPAKPAFMQHPCFDLKEGKAFALKATTPDELDVLVTAKNHDVKGARIAQDSVGAWLFAIASYQTMSGFLGQGNYGIVRMNSGAGSRAILSLVSKLNPSGRFQEELSILRGMRSGLLGGPLGFKAKGVVLTWLGAWDRQGHQFTLSDLEPFFVEAARPLRMAIRDGAIVALGATSKARQIGPKTLESGDVGDPWTPINVSDKKKGRSALSVSANGFTPKLLADLLFQQEFELTSLQKPREGKGGAWFTGSVLVRGQGTTEGFHRFAIPIPEQAKMSLLHDNARKRMGEFAQALLGDASAVEKMLRGALMALAEGGPENTDFKRDTLNAWARPTAAAYSRAWEEEFFPTLWRWAEEEEEALRASWKKGLAERAFRILDEADRRLPIPSNRSYRALVRARGFLTGSLIKKGILSRASQPEIREEVP